MKSTIAIMILLVATCGVVYAQSDNSKEIKEIKERYKTVTAEIEKIEESPDAAVESEFAVNELTINKLNKRWPAVGTYSVVYRFYYMQFGEEPYPDTLVMVKKLTVSAARKYREEHLFSERGDLIFSYYKNDEGERRLYLKDGAVIKYTGRGDETEKAAANDDRVKKYLRLFLLSIG